MNQPSNQTRRDFLKHSAGVVAASAASASLLRAPAAYGAAADDTIKIALIGAGGRGGGAAAQALSTAGPTKLVAIADAFEDNAKNALENLRNHDVADKVDVGERVFHGFDAYQKAIDSGADVVILATPPGFRPIHFEAAVKAGKHVFMEKPVATDAAGVRKVLEMAKVAKQKNLKVGVGLQRHHDPKYQALVKRVHDGAIGDPVLLRVYWNGGGVWVRNRKPEQTEMEYQMRNWYYFNWLCGDHINEQHIHNLDVANWIKNGAPVSAQGQGGRQVRTGVDHGEIYDHHMVEFTYADGTKMLSQCRHIPNTPDLVDEFGHGTKGEAHIGGGSIKTRDGSEWRYQGKGGDPYQIEHDVLFDAIRNNKPHNEAEYGATSTMTAIMGRMATYSGQVIYWDKAAAQKAGQPDAPVAMESTQNLIPDVLAWDAKPPTLPDAQGRYPIPMPGSTKFA
ncbi:MAG: Putative oxidoreductase [uncultured Phycisphaerae bacterium]|uniref:Oxidoreductase n=1 Tax=uncultured Phycisphaerae bacterium TaxID=904963 RepID=A0A6J4PC33_9BACT|nr:MAG: Putative oxidoreductase [uncultured Phycisphaerae bacterium]